MIINKYVTWCNIINNTLNQITAENIVNINININNNNNNNKMNNNIKIMIINTVMMHMINKYTMKMGYKIN